MNLRIPVYIVTIILVLPFPAIAQFQDLAAVYPGQDATVSHLLFTEDGPGFSMNTAFHARDADLNENHPHLTVSGDFTGDGLDEIALFDDMLYKPNMNPEFTSSVVWINRSQGDRFLPSGSWFSVLDSGFSFDHIDFSLAADYNLDGFCDIALFYNDHSSDSLTIYVLESDGSGFSDPISWYSCSRVGFNFTAVKFASPGDFNGNGFPDIAVFYNYFGTVPETRQAVFLFESDGNTFSLLPAAYDATKASYDFTNMKFASPGLFNQDGYWDMAVLHEDPIDQDLIVTVFEGAASGQLSPVDYNIFMDSEPFLPDVLFAQAGNLAGDTATDLALFYDNQGTGSQEILVLESELSSFKSPETVFTTDAGSLSMAELRSVQAGSFFHQPLVRAASWMDDKQGAVSFTFDDGYRGAFEHGGEELEAAGVKGTFYIFTDTSTVYDGELASTALVREYKDKGFEIASHTANHSNLGYLTESGDVDSLNQVLSSSKEILDERFDQQTYSMSIPFGSFRHETLAYIAQFFLTARSSQHGFNLATPYDYYALKSWPILSTTSPSFVDNLLATAETCGTYLPLMYHDMVDEPFDEDLFIYTYSRELFHETLQLALSRDLWIDTHERTYKYIRQRNALKIRQLDISEIEAQAGHFSFEADDGLSDSIFNVELTLKISLPESWTEDTVSVGPDGLFSYSPVLEDDAGRYVLFNWLPVNGISVQVHDGRLPGTGIRDLKAPGSARTMDAAPNPFLNETLISISGEENPDAYMIVRDIQGRLVREIRDGTANAYRFAREDLSPGIYIIQLIDPGFQGAFLKLIAQ